MLKRHREKNPRMCDSCAALGRRRSATWIQELQGRPPLYVCDEHKPSLLDPGLHE